MVKAFDAIRLRPLGKLFGTLLLEPHTLARAGFYEHIRFRKSSKSYGLDQFKPEHKGKAPVLIIPGLVGSWRYLNDLEQRIMESGRAVFTIEMPKSIPTDESRKHIQQRVEEIRQQYLETFKEESPKVDLVAHSMGSNHALCAMFTEETSHISKGDLVLHRHSLTPEDRAYPNIGKLVTVALQSDAMDLRSLEIADSVNRLYNVIAKYDILMGHKKKTLLERGSDHAVETDSGHIGIVYDKKAHEAVVNFLDR